MPTEIGRLTLNADSIRGSAADEVITVPARNGNLAAQDTLQGLGGTDTLLFENTAALGINHLNMPGVSGIEVLDFRAASEATVVLNDDAIGQSDADRLRLVFDGDPLLLDMREVTAGFGQVELAGTGRVTLRDTAQEVTVANGVAGLVDGGSGRDTLAGGSGSDSLSGAAGDDALSGGGGNDTLAGGDDNDALSGGAGNDTLSGGAGFDVLTGGAGSTRASGGAQSDLFVLTAGETLTITDFDTADPFERIDLRAFAGLDMGDLGVADTPAGARVTLPDGSSVTLSGVSAAALGAEQFLFAGDPVLPLAQALGSPPDFEFTEANDRFTGGAGNEVFELKGNFAKLAATDLYDGRGGIDTLRIWGDDRALGETRLAGMTGIEIVDLSGARSLTAPLELQVTQAMVDSSVTGTVTVKFGSNDIIMLTGQVDDAASVIIEGTGTVTLRDTPGQGVTISDAYAGHVVGQNKNDMVLGGAKGDRIEADGGEDTVSGGGGNDLIDGGSGNDTLLGGEGNDTLLGGEDNDLLRGGAGANRLDGGDGFDQYIIEAGAQGTVIADYNPRNFVERIDLTALDQIRGMGDLTLTDTAGGVRVTGAGLNLQLEGVRAAALDGGDFIFDGQDPLLFRVGPGTTNAELQQLLDGAPQGAVIEVAAGTYHITQTLTISRGDITLRGAGEGQTVFVTDISTANAGATILVQPEDLQVRYGTLDTTLAQNGMQVQLPDLEALRAANPDAEYDPFQVGDLIFIAQPNDPAYLTATGNLSNDGNPANDWREPRTSSELEAELYYLREFRSRIVAIDENGVATLAEASPYTFEAGRATVARNTFLSNVNLSGFTIEGAFADETGGAPDPFLFENTMPEWASIAALELDGVRDSSLSDITVINPAAHGFKWQRAHETTAEGLTAIGAHNKDGSSGYHFLLQESFSNDLSDLSSTDSRHAVLFSSYNAEHYNSLHLSYANRDINFHGSADTGNTIVVDLLEQNYPADGSTEQWRAVGPGVIGLHPNSDIEGNDVTFRQARTGDRSDAVTTHAEGGQLWLRDGSDLGLGQGGNDRMWGEAGNDTLLGNGGSDALSGGLGKDSLDGGAGDDTLEGGDDNDTLRGGAGNDLIIGGLNGDSLFGGSGRDTFRRDFLDLTDTIFDFEAGPAGDILQIRGTAYTQFSDLQMRQSGDDVIVDYGTGGNTVLRNVTLGSLTAANFAFGDDGTAGQTVALRATEFFGLGTQRNDSFSVSRAHMDSGEFRIHAGAGYDRVVIAQSSLNADLGATGRYSGVEEFDLSTIATLGLVVENPLVSQSSSGKLYLSIGDSGSPVLLDIGPLGRGKNVFIDGARAVQLTGGREHTVKSGDRIGVDITGDTLRDIIYGGRQDDVLRGGGGNDVLFGAAGEDTLYGGTGNDTLNGGPGSDILYIEDAGDRVSESRRWEGTDHVITAVDFRMGTAHIETMALTGTAILGAGNGLRNRITGNAQDNILDGGKNVDTLVGGLGDDIYLIRAPGDNAVERAGEGIDTVRAFRAYELDDNVENLFLQTLRNAAGEGVAGVNGIGNTLDNLIIGNPFDNVITGREGNDTLRGQAGDDSFVFDRALGAGNVDRIQDFETIAGDDDTLMMRQSVFAGMVKGTLAASAFHAGTQAMDAADRFIFDRASGRLWFDEDGAGGAAQQLVAEFDANAQLSAEDILIF